jgi:hypothetical protein
VHPGVFRVLMAAQRFAHPQLIFGVLILCSCEVRVMAQSNEQLLRWADGVLPGLKRRLNATYVAIEHARRQAICASEVDPSHREGAPAVRRP